MERALANDPNLQKPSVPAYYGTAGYRSRTGDLNNVICRASLIAYLRSSTFAGKTIGIMITASHNPVEYNGIKFIDHSGDMLDEAWEHHSDRIVNCDDKDLLRTLKKVFRIYSNHGELGEGVSGHVVVGRDTRESGEELCNNIRSVLCKLNCAVDDYGVVTTPEMHYLVRRCNAENRTAAKDEYLRNLALNFRELRALTENNIRMKVDTANGVVGLKLQELNDMLEDSLNFEILNDSDGVLNLGCGADFIKTGKKAPAFKKLENYTPEASEILSSFDGDADRLVFFSVSTETQVLDGDSQAVFLAFHIRALLAQVHSKLSIGVVLSYYSNNAAVDALSPSFKTVMVQTGVKNFVSASRNFDIGIYFEPNGHGSICFSTAALKEIHSSDTKAHRILRAFSNLFDPCIGDALGNFLVFKSILTSIDDLKKFKENPSTLMAVRIADKSVIRVDHKNQVIEPPNLQEKIDVEALGLGGRAFVRPSGTEDVVRIYAECPREVDADMLCIKVAQMVYDMCGGVGNHPEIDYTK
jgi:phosphoacetylglucosamine mutase